MISARELALKVLYKIDSENAYSNIELKNWLDSSELSQVDKSFVTELVYGTMEWKLNIDWIISQLSSVKLNKISTYIINILRIGIYQIKFLDKIPNSAAVNECVKLAKKYGHMGSVKFVNGLLRNFSKNVENIKYPDKSDGIKFLSVVYSHPEWLVSDWLNKYSFEFTENLCKANNGVAPINARVNTLKCSAEQLKEAFISENVEFENSLYFENSFNIKPQTSISNLSSFKDGLFQIQDESSMLVGNVANPKAGQIVIDVCAAPGGKSTHLAQIMKNEGTVYSRDIHEHKIKLIEDSAKRLGINIISTKLFDATELDETLVGKCHLVLVDAPCSGLGIIRRKPDIKWNRQIQDKQSLVDIQNKILSVSSNYVKAGGEIVYSTCTIDDDENINVVRRFLENNKEFSLVDISDNVPKKLLKDSCKDGYIQIYTNVDKIDGFFVAKMRKNI